MQHGGPFVSVNLFKIKMRWLPKAHLLECPSLCLTFLALASLFISRCCECPSLLPLSPTPVLEHRLFAQVVTRHCCTVLRGTDRMEDSVNRFPAGVVLGVLQASLHSLKPTLPPNFS